ncbi:hypothetical protein MASR1M101_00280 [Gemmatimonas sp.]
MKIRRTASRVAFMEYLAAHSPTTKVGESGKMPTVPAIIAMEHAGLFTTRGVDPRPTKHGFTSHTMEFTITDKGRAWLARTIEAETPHG